MANIKLQIKNKYGWEYYVDRRFRPYKSVTFPSVKKAMDARTSLGRGNIYFTRIVDADTKRIIVDVDIPNNYD